MQSIQQKIIDYLQKTTIGASSSDIAKHIKHNRVTVSKYLEVLRAEGIVDYVEVGQAKLWTVGKSKPKILIVDDEVNVINLIKLSLTDDTYEIYETTSGTSALDIAKRITFDVIILDLMMPDISGFDVCATLKSSVGTKRSAIIILSAKSQIQDKKRCFELGADDYLTKPFDPMELEARVKRLITKQSEPNDIHPLTKLAGKEALLEAIKESQEKDTITKLTIKHLDELRDEKSHKKVDELLLLFARMITKNDNKGFHLLNDVFITIGSQPTDALKEDFQNLLLYACDGCNAPKLVIETFHKNDSQLTSSLLQ